VNQFAHWLSTTDLSLAIKGQQAWLIPAVQSIHIAGIAVVVGSVFMMSLRVLGGAGMDQSVRQVYRRFGPWLNAALWILAASGLVLIVGEPVRELITFSFWLKMSLLAVGILIAATFGHTVRKHEEQWDEAIARRGSVKALAVVTLLVWGGIIICGRLIAYDHVWGALSPAARY
jgi:uncharacterized membrane protein SirB2